MKTSKKHPCDGCHYWRTLYPCHACHYMYVTGHMRGCPAGKECTRRKPMNIEELKSEVPELLKRKDYSPYGIY